MTTPLAQPPEKYEQRWMFLLWKRVVATVLSFTSEAVGFTISGGTTSKTLTVPLDATVSGTNTGDNAGVTSVAVSGANGIGVSGSPITSSGTIALSLGDITPTGADISGGFRVSGFATPTSGKSIEVGVQGGTTGRIFSYDRTGGAYFLTIIDASTLNLNGNSGGNVGIGFVGATSYLLDVAKNQDAATELRVANSNNSASGRANVIFSSNAASAYLSAYSSGHSESYYAGTAALLSTGTLAITGYTDIKFGVNGYFTEVMRLTNSEKLCIGTTGTTIGNATKVQVAGTTAAANSLGVSAWSADALGSRIELGKSRGATVGTNTIVQANDVVASVTGYGANGSTFTNLASISMEVDGTPGATNDMPGRVVISTTPDGSGTLTEAIRFDSAQATTFAARANLKSYTVATLPAAGIASGLVYVADAGGNGPCIAMSDGANWKRCDNTSTTVV